MLTLTRDDVGMTRWVRSHWDEEDVTFFWEVGDDGWVTRGVELVGPEQRAQSAAALDEWMRELEAGRIQQYQARYGVLTDQPIEDWDFPHKDLSLGEFEHVWRSARQALEAAP
jgi:hypothetical protein